MKKEKSTRIEKIVIWIVIITIILIWAVVISTIVFLGSQVIYIPIPYEHDGYATHTDQESFICYGDNYTECYYDALRIEE